MPLPRYIIESALAIRVNLQGVVRWLLWVTLICLMVAVLSACSGEPQPNATLEPTPTLVSTAIPTSVAPVIPTPEPAIDANEPDATATTVPGSPTVAPTMPAVDATLSAAEIFNRISPSVMFH